ncbi:hypothetical protein JCM19237_5881 [Photobacterium aphoticum]|uniref:Uncharacterized protein n=1 Tax=Photobacterium aphoticum TaxID=754436 RepID=A0A090QL94_9GAMM|nr:hypothetical protein JCM19237_5881 [Photobacterium aphoticum]
MAYGLVFLILILILPFIALPFVLAQWEFRFMALRVSP